MNDTIDATAVFAPLWRGKWLILIVGVLVAVGTYVHYKKAPSTYAVKTQLYLGAASEGQSLLNSTLGKTNLNATTLANQVTLINSSVSEEVHRRLRREHRGAVAHGKVHAKAVSGSDFITLTAEAHTAAGAALLANAFADAYIRRHQRNYEQAVKGAIATTRRQIHRIELAQLAKAKAGKNGSSGTAATLQAASLNTKLNQLESDLSLSGVEQIGPAKPGKAELLGSGPKKNAIFGFVIGIVLATLAVYVVSRFDRRLRSLTAIEGAFHAPILSVLPTMRTPIVRKDGQVRTSRLLSEPLRRLHATLELQSAGAQDAGTSVEPRSILFVSADPGDGKSTVAAGLALVRRDAGEQVALVEADFRRPVLARLLDVPGAHGLADVINGTLPLNAAIQKLKGVDADRAAEPEDDDAGAVATLVQSPQVGSVSLLAGSTDVANPPALLAREATTELLRALAEDYDCVLVDAPPPLQVSDVMPLLTAVDGIVIVARVGHTRGISAERLMQLLTSTAMAPVLGVVANAASRADMERHGFYADLARRRWPLTLLGR